MPNFDRSTGRVAAVIMLLITTAAALRGYLPGIERVDRQPSRTGGSLVYVAALLSVSLVIVAVALIARLRDSHPVASSVAPLSTRPSRGSGRPPWRVLLIGAVMLLLWLLVLWLLSHLVGTQHLDQPRSPAPSAVPASPGGGVQGPAPADDGADRGMLRYLIAGTVALLAMTVVGAVVARRRRVVAPLTGQAPRAAEPGPSAVAATSLMLAAESGLAEVEDPDHQPRQAIIACYAAMERELRNFPGAMPQDFDTPAEVLARAVERRALRVDHAEELVELFEEARFSDHVMTETHRSRAVDVLQLVLADIQSLV